MLNSFSIESALQDCERLITPALQLVADNVDGLATSDLLQDCQTNIKASIAEAESAVAMKTCDLGETMCKAKSGAENFLSAVQTESSMQEMNDCLNQLARESEEVLAEPLKAAQGISEDVLANPCIEEALDIAGKKLKEIDLTSDDMKEALDAIIGWQIIIFTTLPLFLWKLFNLS